jgi:hypothetical protein
MGIMVMYVEINLAQLILVWNDNNIWVYCAEPYKNWHPKKANNRKSIKLVIKFKNIAIIIGIKKKINLQFWHHLRPINFHKPPIFQGYNFPYFPSLETVKSNK